MNVYLAGPINAATDSETRDWREQVKALLPRHIGVYDPMDRDYRGEEDEKWAEIVEADLGDLEHCDVLLAYCPKPSVGTSMEVYRFYTERASKWTIVVVPPGSPVSPWMRYCSDFLFRSLDEAVAKVLEVGEDFNPKLPRTVK